ncbi:glycosyl hydrolase [uncultured Draconibacterium sp.]|uniref:glycosyl hydrolase n=1 Tax=uncultured Draconibacterium sp. TaxID=1573823 RepID=UPI002AA86465|nr:glycosyl hydrolase [uncultured Draconibacterium sp.]
MKQKIIPYFKICILSLIVVLISCSGQKNEEIVDLHANFKNPPNEARPRVWWHWMNGNVTKDGIRKDLEWMNRVGIGGFQNFDAAVGTPQIVDNRLAYMTPQWKEAFLFTTKLADSLGFEMAIAGSPGWSESGGPWVPSSEGMKKMVWTETRIEGGQTFNDVLPHPPTISGSFQNIGINHQTDVSNLDHEEQEYYQDVCVLAYKIPETDFSMLELKPKVTSSSGNFSLEMLNDGDLVTSSFLPADSKDNSAWIQFEFEKPQTIHSVSMVGGGSVYQFGFGNDEQKRFLEASDDGVIFKPVTEIIAGGINQNTVTFSAVTAKFFRVVVIYPDKLTNPFDGLEGLDSPEVRENLSSRTKGTEISELVLHTSPRIHHFEQKAGFAVVEKVENLLTPETPSENLVKANEIINVTDKMAKDGTLIWTVPEGKWNIIRMGYSLTGHKNTPASPEATGLEVDKLNRKYVQNYFNNYLDQYQDATNGLMGEKGLQYVITDSWEAGAANWTDNMIEEFNERNSYDIKPWLPVLTGKIVESSIASEKFLWDFRNTLEAMVTEYHYDELTTILKARGMGRYSESHENNRVFVADGMEVKRSADIPMSATWTPGGFGGPSDKVNVNHETDIRESASVAHIYGQNLVAAESFTAIGNAWGYAPADLKPTADFMLASGLNRFVIHTSVHQPVDDKIPGIGLGPFGQWFTRHETWAEQAKPWMDYLARSSYMLQQGKFVADIIYVYGLGSNLTSLFQSQLPEIPKGYNYDFLNAGAVANVLSVNNGELVTETGMNYKLLVLDESTRYMTLPVLKKIQQLVNDGAVILGTKPVDTPSLNDDKYEFQEIVRQLWDEGKVHSGLTIEQLLTQLGIEPDFEYSTKSTNSEMDFVHRTLGNQEIYWVNTTSKEEQTDTVSFRTEGFKPEIWNPVNGDVIEASYKIADGRTLVTLDLEPEDAVFIVFREKSAANSVQLPRTTETELATLTGEWQVNFQANRGASERTVVAELAPWNENEDTGIKYFSGTAEYTKTFEITEESISEGKEIWLDLGEVKNLAEITLNGTPLGIVWKKPFKVKLNEAIKAGENQLSVKVTNHWVNRLIGDAQPDIANKLTYTTMPFYTADSQLKESGLLGPVRIISKSVEL